MNPRAGPATSRMICAGCGAEAPAVPDPAAGAGHPFRCPGALDGDDCDHVLARTLDLASVAFPCDGDPNPFVAYRTLFHSWHVARARGMADADYVALVRALDDDVARADGCGFRVTPFGRQGALSDRLGAAGGGGIWVKDETGNVSGSHKARHLMGIMIYLQVLGALGLTRSSRLAIASCGNAALAAAVVARAARLPLDVFIPPDAPERVVARLAALGARALTCRREGDTPGDPCYLRFRDEVLRGALPFCCQGPANGLTIEGGETIGFEMIAAPGATALDAVVIQVGGGALASAVIQSFVEAVALGACARLPRFYTVQTHGAFPLQRAYDRLAGRIATALATDGVTGADPVALAATRFDTPAVQRELHYAATHRRSFMWPWDAEPHSLARGILDDETYDWFAVVKGMLRTGGRPLVVDETTLAAAHDLARETTGIVVDHTGASGLAGLMQLVRDGTLTPRDNVAVVFSGRER